MDQPKALAVVIPLINPNEPEALLASVHVQEGQKVCQGDPLCSLETTKATLDMTADREGYIIGLQAKPGQVLEAGAILCYIAASANWQPPASPSDPGLAVTEKPTESEIPPGLRITKPALELSRSHQIDLTKFPIGPLITEEMVRAELAHIPTSTQSIPISIDENNLNAMILYGGGGHAKALIDLIRTIGQYHIAAVIDDGFPKGHLVMGIPVVGDSSILTTIYQQGIRLAVNAIGGISNIRHRIQGFDTLTKVGFTFPILIHPSAVVEQSARLSAGTQVFPQAYVGSEVEVGFGVIINSGTIVSHDCQLGDYVNLSPGAILAGEVTVGEGALIGMGVTINLRVKIGAYARIGNGATIKSDVPENGIVRAGTIWPK